MKKVSESIHGKTGNKTPHIFFLTVFVLFVSVVIMLSTTTFLAAESRGPNLISNPTFDSSLNGWTASINASRDTTVYRGTSGASARLQGTGMLRALSGSPRINVTPGKHYTLRFYLKSDNAAVGSKAIFWSYKGNYESAAPWQDHWVAPSKTNTWQEVVLEYKAGPEVEFVTIDITNAGDGGEYTLWVDDAYFGEGKVGFEQPASSKTPFNGDKVKVDASGNFEINRNGTFKPFFPFGIMNYYSITAERAQEYSEQGFNFTAGGHSATALGYLKNATSVYNPEGMMALAGVLFQTDYDTTAITNMVTSLKNSNSADAILAWYFEPSDGSRDFTEYPQVLDAYNAFRAADTGRPVFNNFGEVGYPRAYDDAQDISGTWVYPRQGYSSQVGAYYKSAANIEGKVKPHPIVTLSSTDEVVKPTPAELRSQVYHAIWGGAKGIIFWWEKQADGSAVDTTDLWPAYPVLRNEIETILPVIRQGAPSFFVDAQTQEDNKRVDVLAKEYNGDPYLVVVNTEDTQVSVVFTLFGLNYQSATANEIFNKGDINFSGNSFSLSLEPYATRVFKVIGTKNSIPAKPKPNKPKEPNKPKDLSKPKTYARGISAKRRGSRKIATGSLRWKVKDPYTGNKTYVKLRIQKRNYSKARAARKARYLKLYRQNMAKYRASNNRIYFKRANKYLRAYRKTSAYIYKTVKYAKYGWTSINKTRVYRYKTRSKGLYRFLVYAKDRAGNDQQNIAKGSFRIR